MIVRGLLLGCVMALSSCAIRLPSPPPAATTRVEVSNLADTSKRGQRAAKDPEVMVWLVADKLHTGVVFPYEWLAESGYKAPAAIGRPKFVTLSWGNREAYLNTRWLTPGEALRALFTPSPSVMEIIPFDWDVTEVCHHQRIWYGYVPRDRGVFVAAFLNNMAKYDAAGRPVTLSKTSWGKGQIIDSPHKYYLPRICNVWTAQAFEACGFKMNAWRSVMANGVVHQLESQGFQHIWNGYDKEVTQPAH